MRKLTSIAFGAGLALSGAATEVAAELRIGVVNPVKVLEAAPQAGEAKKRLEREFQPRDRSLLAAQKKVKELEDRLAKAGASDSARRNLEREIISMKRDLKRDHDEFRDDLTLRRNEEFSKIQKQVVEAIQSLARDEGFDLVVGEGVIYASDKIDITSKVVSRLRGGGGGGGGAARKSLQ